MHALYIKHSLSDTRGSELISLCRIYTWYTLANRNITRTSVCFMLQKLCLFNQFTFNMYISKLNLVYNLSTGQRKSGEEYIAFALIKLIVSSQSHCCGMKESYTTDLNYKKITKF